jgi:hypothetical protein
MDKIRIVEGDLVARDVRFSIVASRFNEFIVESLIKGALSCLRRHGADDSDIEIVRVPGALTTLPRPSPINLPVTSLELTSIAEYGRRVKNSSALFESERTAM